MSKTIKLTLSDHQYEALHELAQADMLSDQDYIRSRLFPKEEAITPLDAVNKALAKYHAGDTFTVPEIYGDKWDLPNGQAGIFGQAFETLVLTHYSTRIRSLKDQGVKREGRVVYQLL